MKKIKQIFLEGESPTLMHLLDFKQYFDFLFLTE